MKWAGAFEQKPQKVFVTHGEDSVTELFAARLHDELGYDAYAPFSGTVFDLASGEFLEEAEGVRITPKPAVSAATKKANAVFDRLFAAGQRLLAVIRKNEGGANKDLAKFADQINALADKWDRE